MVKNDRWIREMALKHKMIEPFVENQIAKGVISYGLSSYGYDIRIADEFKIFTSVNPDLFATGQPVIVDPKSFNEHSFVDYRGGVCVIPPNSFALGRSVEYFRIPRDILALCVGKSTYARCFRGDTRVALVDGTAPTLEEMAHRAENGELFWGYSIGPTGRIIVTVLEAPRYIGQDALLEIILDTGESIYCTPDHLFMRRDGRWAQAAHLRPGDSLMPLYRKIARGYEMVYQPLNGHFFPTHRLADEWNTRRGIYEDMPSTHRHHLDHNRRNNNPWNITRMDASGHIRHHNRESYGESFDPREHSAAIRGALRRLSGFPEVIRAFRGERKNHKVAAIREIPGLHDVYCLTVPEAGNFALEAGVFVHNCGIIVNITPAEPEWEGQLVIEISNTSPLPAKIYANEGIAQMIFLEAHEVCEVSYADRKGKYQKQIGIVTSKVQ